MIVLVDLGGNCRKSFSLGIKEVRKGQTEI